MTTILLLILFISGVLLYPVWLNHIGMSVPLSRCRWLLESNIMRGLNKSRLVLRSLDRKREIEFVKYIPQTGATRFVMKLKKNKQYSQQDFVKAQECFRRKNVPFVIDNCSSPAPVLMIECGRNVDMAQTVALIVLREVYGIAENEAIKAAQYGLMDVRAGACVGWDKRYREKFHWGSMVQVVTREDLEKLLHNWKYRHPLTVEQLSYAGTKAAVIGIYRYDDGSVLYELQDIPELWHECCLKYPEEPLRA